MPGFKVQMGFGLHIGWAIEGAIGERYWPVQGSLAKWECSGLRLHYDSMTLLTHICIIEALSLPLLPLPPPPHTHTRL